MQDPKQDEGPLIPTTAPEQERNQPVPATASEQEENLPIPTDGNGDDSAWSSDGTSSFGSLLEECDATEVKNGRTYRAVPGKIFTLPIDEEELVRQDVQHELFYLTLDKLCLSPLTKIIRVLDLATGTGLWAIDFADQHPGAEVIGADISPHQPRLGPPNVQFERDDLEQEWLWKVKFSFVIARMLAGHFNMREITLKAFGIVEGEGWFEIQDLVLPICTSADGTLPIDSPLSRWTQDFEDAARKMKKPILSADEHKENLIKAGFVDVEVRNHRWHTNCWPRDEPWRKLGAWCRKNFDEMGGLEAYSLVLFSEGLGWSFEKIITYCAWVRKSLRNQRIHAYFTLCTIYGRKPGNTLQDDPALAPINSSSLTGA